MDIHSHEYINIYVHTWVHTAVTETYLEISVTDQMFDAVAKP